MTEDFGIVEAVFPRLHHLFSLSLKGRILASEATAKRPIMPKYYYFTIGNVELPHSAFTLDGALVHVRKPDAPSTEVRLALVGFSRFFEQTPNYEFRYNFPRFPQVSSARLRLFDPSASGNLRQNLLKVEHDSVQMIPTLVLDYHEVVKWIVSLAEKTKKDRGHRFLIYWAPTRISNWKTTGFDLELTWAPTAEPARNIPKEDFESQLAWLTPLAPAIEEVVKKRSYLKEPAKKPYDSQSALIYEEDWEWESAHERDFDVAILEEGSSPTRPPPVRQLLDFTDDSDAEQSANVIRPNDAGQQPLAVRESSPQHDHTIPSSSPLMESDSPVICKKRAAHVQSGKSSDDGDHLDDHVGMYDNLFMP